MFPPARVRVVALACLATVVAVSSALTGAARSTGNASSPPALPWAAPAVPGGVNPLGVGINRATHTIYVANGDNTVSVIDGATCNAIHTAGCTQTPPTASIGGGAIGLAVNQRTNTIYVANSADNTVSVIDGATCNATDTSGCGQTPATVAVGTFPIVLAIDEASDTIYVTNGGDNTVSVIDGGTCNGSVTSGCSHTPATVTVGSSPQGIGIDQPTDTIYVANGGDNTVSVINGAICNSSTSAGCGQTPPTVAAHLFPGVLAIDQASHTVYVTGGTLGDSFGSVALINAATCNATVTSGCGQTPSTAPVGSTPGWVARGPRHPQRLRRQPVGQQRLGAQLNHLQRDRHLGLRQDAAGDGDRFRRWRDRCGCGHRHGLCLEPG